MPNRNEYRQDGPLDAEAGAFFQDELRSIDKRILEDDRAPLNGFQVIPQDNKTAGPWDNQYEERSMQFTGLAEFLGDAADDMPFVDVGLRADVYNIRTFGCAFMHTVAEIEKARSIGRPLDEWRGRAARVANEEKFNRIMWYGDPAAQLFGVLNNPFANRFFFDNDLVFATAAATPSARPAERRNARQSTAAMRRARSVSGVSAGSGSWRRPPPVPGFCTGRARIAA